MQITSAKSMEVTSGVQEVNRVPVEKEKNSQSSAKVVSRVLFAVSSIELIANASFLCWSQGELDREVYLRRTILSLVATLLFCSLECCFSETSEKTKDVAIKTFPDLEVATAELTVHNIQGE